MTTEKTKNNKRRKSKSGGRPPQKSSGFSNRRPKNNSSKPKKALKRVDPALLVKKATTSTAVTYQSDRRIEDLPIDNKLKQTLAKKGYNHPTEIQDKTLEDLLSGNDLLGIAQTGSGKTAAFLVPIINQLLKRDRNPYALVVVPTRELATQIQEEFRSMTKDFRLYSSCFIGGTNINKDVQACRRDSHIVIATPGRLLDLMERKCIDLGKFHTLVLDEFDRMLDMGFVRDVQRIVHKMYQRQQTMLFSATLNKKQKPLIDDILLDPVTVKVSTGESTGDHIDQEIVNIPEGENKLDILIEMVRQDDFDKVLVFEETKYKVAKLCRKLNQAGIRSEEIHGNKNQNQRQRALDAFKEGKVRVLVATDVAARGLDVSDVTHVINYQLPQTMDTYIHRIGRTGRAGKAGKAYTFVD